MTQVHAVDPNDPGAVAAFSAVAALAHADDPTWAPGSEEAAAWAFGEAAAGRTPLRAYVATDHGRPCARGAAFAPVDGVGWVGLVDWVPGSESAALAVLEVCDDAQAAWSADALEAPCSDPLTIGLQVGGFALPQTIFSTHGRPGDIDVFLAAGYSVRRRMVAPIMTREQAAHLPPIHVPGVSVRPIDPARIDDEARAFYTIHDEVFGSRSVAGGRSPGAAERLLLRLQPHIDPELVLLAERDGVPVGNLLCLPDRWQQGRIDRARIVSIAVSEDHRGTGVGLAMAGTLARTLLDKGYRSVEGVWVRAENVAPQALAARFGGTLGRRFAVLGKSLLNQPGPSTGAAGDP